MKRLLGILAIVAFLVIAVLPPAHTVSQALLGHASHIEALGQFFFSQRVLGLFAQSLQLGWWVSMCCLTIGVPMGFLISRTDIYGRRVARYLCLLPLAIPPYIAAIAWMKCAGSAGVEPLAHHLYGPLGVVWVLSLSYVPFVSLLTVAGLASSSRAMEEQAELMVGPWKAIRRITLPLIAPFVLAGALFVFVFSISNYGVPSLLRVNTYPMEIFAQYAAFYNHPLASLSALPLLFVTGVVIAISYAVMHDRSYVSFTAGAAQRIIPLRRYRWLCSLFVWIVIAVSGILPLGVLVLSSGSALSYWLAFKTSVPAIVTSVGLSTVSAILCTLLGYGLAYLIRRTHWRGKTMLDVATVLPLAVPGTVLGISLIELWNRPATSVVYAGLPVMVFALIARCVPFSIRILFSGLHQIHTNLEEAAALTGAGLLKRARRIMFPLLTPGLLASFSICFIFSMAEIDATLLVMPPGSETLASKIYTLMHYDVGAFTTASCVLLIVLSMAPVGLLGYVAARGRRP